MTYLLHDSCVVRTDRNYQA